MMLAHCTLEGQSGHEAAQRLLAALYREKTGKDLPEIGKTPLGKPFFREDPLHFSISHTRHHAFCVLSEGNVGLDAEELDRRVDPRLAAKILSPLEKQQYDAAADQPGTLLAFWVLKEAQAKLTGRGLRLWPNHTAFTLPHPALREIDGCLVAVLTEEMLRNALPTGQ